MIIFYSQLQSRLFSLHLSTLVKSIDHQFVVLINETSEGLVATGKQELDFISLTSFFPDISHFEKASDSLEQQCFFCLQDTHPTHDRNIGHLEDLHSLLIVTDYKQQGLII